MRKRTTILFALLTVGCGGTRGIATQDCPAGQVRIDDVCRSVCQQAADCTGIGEDCVQGVCVSSNAPPAIHEVTGNNTADATKVADGIVAHGARFLGATFALQDSQQNSLSIAVRELTQTRAELVFASDMVSGQYTLVATNSSGEAQATVALTLPELDGDAVIAKINASATTGTISAARLPQDPFEALGCNDGDQLRKTSDGWECDARVWARAARSATVQEVSGDTTATVDFTGTNHPLLFSTETNAFTVPIDGFYRVSGYFTWYDALAGGLSLSLVDEQDSEIAKLIVGFGADGERYFTRMVQLMEGSEVRLQASSVESYKVGRASFPRLEINFELVQEIGTVTRRGG